ncbi:MAG: hypothetical protein HY922_10785 [Elusimicrobia bacterium]|nr:hypothetical protein [Elusimicrobiota bacterium]
MKKSLRWIVGVSVVAVVLAGAAQAEKARGKSGAGHPAMCPMHIEGATVKIENVDDGVMIRITAKDPEVVNKIQETAANKVKEGPCSCCSKHGGKEQATKKKEKGETIYSCPMGCYKGPKTKDGRCPKCGMMLNKI